MPVHVFAMQPCPSMRRRLLTLSSGVEPRQGTRSLQQVPASCYTWSMTQSPAEDTAVIQAPSNTITNVVGVAPGTYTFQLRVLDNSGGMAITNVT
ncbi:hypothetical protein HaLaN_11467, partial [Haematococcus lacustris]